MTAIACVKEVSSSSCWNCPVCGSSESDPVELSACRHLLCRNCLLEVQAGSPDRELRLVACQHYACPLCARLGHPVGCCPARPAEEALSVTVHGLVVEKGWWEEAVEGRREAMRRRYQAYEEQFRRLRLLFVHIPKCAGTSFERVVMGFDNTSQHAPVRLWRQRLGADWCAGAVKVAIVRHPYFRVLSGYSYWRSGALIGQAADAPFVHRCRTELDTLPKFVDYLLHVHRHRLWDEADLQGADGTCPVQFRPQTWFLDDGGSAQDPSAAPSLAHIDILIRFEDLHAGYQLLRDRLLPSGLSLPDKLPHTRASLHPRVLPACFSTTPFRAALFEIYQHDFELLGYDPNDITTAEPLS